MERALTVRFLLVFLIAFGATLLGSLSGGSVSLLTTPSWLALGVPLPTAVACDKVAGAFWTALGSRNYLRHRDVDWRMLLGMGAIGLAGAWLGTRVTVSVDPVRLKRVVGALILLAVLAVAIQPQFGLAPRPPRVSRWIVGLLGLPLGFYEGLLGSGNGIATTLLLCTGRGFDLPTALGHYYLIAGAWCAFAAVSYISHGFFDLGLMIPAAAGSLIGGSLGSHFGSRRGAGFLRVVFSIAGIALALKLLLGG